MLKRRKESLDEGVAVSEVGGIIEWPVHRWEDRVINYYKG